MEYRTGERMSQSQDVRNSGVLLSWMDRWVWASYCNHNLIFKEMVQQQKPYSLHHYQKKFTGKPALILGAGKSLDNVLPLIKDWEGDIFCPESMAKTCAYYGHKPEYVMCFDGNESVWQLFLKDFDWTGSTMVTHPCVSVELLEKWPAEKIYYLMMHYSRLRKEPKGNNLREIEADAKKQLRGFDFFEHDQQVAYNFIKCQILNAGCVVNNSIQVAHFMGYGPLFLCGVDLGFTNWNNRSDKWELKEGEWVCTPGGVIKHEIDGVEYPGIEIGREIVMSNNGIPTTEEQIEYKTALLSVYRLDRPQLFDCSDGIITELPKANIKEVVKRNGRGLDYNYRTDEEIIRISDNYLHRR